ncbi:uncharacterized protein E2P81_ATG04843 [Venturia nashicola]|nr:uncharacterized protein E2P81_ATG04843 [Venturia nashicola]
MLQVPLASRSFRTDDFTYSSVDFAVTTNVVVHLSLITAIVPRIRLLATPTAFLSAAQPNPHATHPLSPLRPLSPQISSLPRLNLDLIMTNTSDHSRDPHNRQYPTSAQPTPDVMSTRTSSLSYESHNRPYSQQPLIKALSREATHSTGKESTSINADTTPLELVPASTLARLNTNVYRPYAIAESVHSNWSKDTSEIEYAWGGYTNVPIATETPKVLEIGMKTEVQIEVDEVGGQRSNSLGEQRLEKVKPRDILKLEQKRNCRRIDESSVYIRGGFGTYS